MRFAEKSASKRRQRRLCKVRKLKKMFRVQVGDAEESKDVWGRRWTRFCGSGRTMEERSCGSRGLRFGRCLSAMRGPKAYPGNDCDKKAERRRAGSLGLLRIRAPLVSWGDATSRASAQNKWAPAETLNGRSSVAHNPLRPLAGRSSVAKKVGERVAALRRMCCVAAVMTVGWLAESKPGTLFFFYQLNQTRLRFARLLRRRFCYFASTTRSKWRSKVALGLWVGQRARWS